jgi:hypothetical protein
VELREDEAAGVVEQRGERYALGVHPASDLRDRLG